MYWTKRKALQNRANSVIYYASEDLSHKWHTESTLFMKGNDFKSKRKKNHSSALKTHADFSFNNFDVQRKTPF